MTKRMVITIGAVVIGLGVGWALFRPELLFINARVSESFPAASSGSFAAQTVALATGSFHGVTHETKGTAAIYQVGQKRVLRLTDFETSNGPDLRVFLVQANDASDSDTVKKAGYTEIARLKGNVGDQNYEIPDDVDLARHRAVTIWCNRFSVNFATAPLSSGGKATIPAAEPTALYSGKSGN